jgi:hypothetical protein
VRSNGNPFVRARHVAGFPQKLSDGCIGVGGSAQYNVFVGMKFRDFEPFQLKQLRANGTWGFWADICCESENPYTSRSKGQFRRIGTFRSDCKQRVEGQQKNCDVRVSNGCHANVCKS